MPISRFFCKNISDNCTIEGSEAHHLCNVMRLKKGDRIELFDGAGSLAEAVITSLNRSKAEFKVEKLQKQPPRNNNRIILVAALAKDQRFDWLIAKATELGVDRICPALYQRTVKQGCGKKIIDRYKNIAISAAKQCKSLFVPVIDDVKPLTEHIGNLQQTFIDPVLIISSLDEDSVGILNSPALVAESDKIVFVGPEGGFSEDEEVMLKQQGAVCVRLTNTILRVETAAIAISSVLAVNRDYPKL